MSRFDRTKEAFSLLHPRELRLSVLSAVDRVGRKLTGHPVWRFGGITPQVLLGGQPVRQLAKHLASMGVTGVVNMRHEYDYKDQFADAPLHYLHLPTIDNTAPTLEHLASGVEFIQRELAKGGKVYIHCQEGLGRGPTMAAAYLVSEGLSPDEAWMKIRTVRPFIRPNKAQRNRLVEFAALRAAVVELEQST